MTEPKIPKEVRKQLAESMEAEQQELINALPEDLQGFGVEILFNAVVNIMLNGFKPERVVSILEYTSELIRERMQDNKDEVH